MAGSKAIKSTMNFLASMQKLIEALKDIDASHFQSLSARKANKFEQYHAVIQNFIDMAYSVGEATGRDHPLLRSTVKTVGVLVFSSDAGFMGKLNTNITREALTLIDDFPAGTPVEIMVMGKKGLVRLRYAEVAKITPFEGIRENTRYEQVKALADYIIKRRSKKKMGDLYVISPKSYGFSKQEVVVKQLLPAFDLFHRKEIIHVEKWQEVCIESPFEDICEYLIQTWMIESLFEAAFESKLAEYSARTTHLEGSLDYLRGELKRVSLAFNKARQSETDAGLRDTFSALMSG